MAKLRIASRVACLVLLTVAATSPLLARLVIVEIHHNPPDSGATELPLEFVEIYNDDVLAVEISGYRFDRGIEYAFPDDTWIDAGGVIVVAADPDRIEAESEGATVFGPFVGRLDNAGEEIRLLDSAGSVVSRIDYNDRGRWPAAADGAGPSLVLRDVLLDPDEGENWGWSATRNGTPGVLSFQVVEPEVFINEVDRKVGDGWIELHNPGEEAVDLEGYRLATTNSGDVGYTFPASVAVEAGGFHVVTQAESGLALGLVESRLILFAPGGERVVDAHHLEEAPPAGSEGRYPDGGEFWYRLDPATPGTANEIPPRPPVVISELHYHPLSDDDSDEFVEIVNIGAEAVDIGGFAFTSGIDYTFPAGTSIAPGEYLVIAKDVARIEVAYGIAGVHGPFAGRLANSGEMVRLVDREERPVDEVRYYDEGSWPRWADGDGPSLELTDLRQDNSVGSAWQESDHAAGSEWKTFEYTATQPGGIGDSEFHIFLIGAGEALIDDVQVRRAGDPNDYLRNGDFEASATSLASWVVDGTHEDSFLDAGVGPDGSAALHLVASRRGDSRVNHIEQQTQRFLSVGEYTVRFKARWLRGSSLLVTRSWGHGLARAHRLEVPPLGGTPGQPNSRAVEDSGPVISRLQQDPALPKASDPVTVQARVFDPDGVATVSLHFRVQGQRDFVELAMEDGGLAGDETAGDSIFTASIAGVGRRGATVEFYITATDGNGATRSFPAGGAEEPYLYQYDDERPTGALPGYRLVMRGTDYLRLRTRSKHSNQLLPASLVYRDERIFHGIGMRYKGSPVVRTAGALRDRQAFRLRLRDEDPFHGATRIVLDDSAPDVTYQVDRSVNRLLQHAGRIPYGQRQYIHLFVQGQSFGIYEDVLAVDSRYLERSFGTADGELYKIDNHYEVRDDGAFDFRGRSWIYSEDKEDLRFVFKKRTGENEDDYSGLIELLEFLDPATTSPEELDARLAEFIDVDQWIRAIAAYRTAADWDTIGGTTGKNIYLYRPPGGVWQIIPWDHDVAMGTWPPNPNTNQSATAPIHLNVGSFAMIRRFMRRPHIDRAIRQHIKSLIEGVYRPASLHPFVQGGYTFLDQTPASEPPCPSNTGRPCILFEALNRVLNYTRIRANYLRTAIQDPPSFGLLAPTRDPAVTVATTESPVTVHGVAPLAIETITRDGQALEYAWVQSARWQATVELEEGLNAIPLEGRDPSGEILGEVTLQIVYDPDGRPFQRGDVNSDGALDIGDPLRLLFHLYAGAGAPACERAADVDDDGSLGQDDAVRLLQHLFVRGPSPAAPFGECDLDTTPDDLGCEAFEPCDD